MGGVLAAAIFDWGNFMNGQVHAWYGFSPYDLATGTEAGFGDLFAANLVGIIAIMAWAGICLSVVFYGLKAGGLLRISSAIEEGGVDAHEFEQPEAYSPKMRGAMSKAPAQMVVGQNGQENKPAI